jgi:hypothetical protein
MIWKKEEVKFISFSKAHFIWFANEEGASQN